MKILICNAGSTSLKFKLWDMPGERALAEGRVERIGMGASTFRYESAASGAAARLMDLDIAGYTQGIQLFLRHLTAPETGAVASIAEISAVGFKTVLAKGYSGVHVIDDGVMKGLEAYLPVAPAHNRPYLEAIRVLRALMPDVPQVGVFETAFHKTIPLHRRLYALPYEMIERYGVMRMGYHGASHSYIAERTGRTGRVISCHLGGSSSLCAILDGQSIDNSFGFSLQTGIPHNNRVGDMDPYVIPFLLGEGLSLEEIDRTLSAQGGLKGISGTAGDMRDIEQAIAEGSERAQLAMDMLVDSIVRYIGSYYMFLGGLDQLVFTGGIGENCAALRAAVCLRLAHVGVQLDEALNQSGEPERIISSARSSALVKVIPAGEELMVVRETHRALSGRA